MSGAGASLGRVLGSLGGPGMAAAIVAGGIAVGALGGGLVASQGGSQPASTTGRLAVYACPESGGPIAEVQAGQRLLATGRTGDGAWLRIHFPAPGRGEAWVQASPLKVDGTVSNLPVAACMPELAVAAPSFEPGDTLTPVQDNSPSPGALPSEAPTESPSESPSLLPSESPSVPPSAMPSGVPNARPTLTALTTSTNKVSYDTGAFCPNAVKRVTFRVKAADDAGLASVALLWREPGAGGFAQTAMTRTAGSAKNGTWQVTLDTTANGITKAGKLAFYAVGTDTSGATRRIPTSGSNAITVAVCTNTGPTIKSASSSAGSTLYWDPLGVGQCQTATNLTAAVSDPQGVKSVTLFYRRPGSSSWQSKPMDNTTIPGKWYANLDTLGDKITIPTPPTGTLRWYIKAVDAKNASSLSKTSSITIRRCDSEANFDGVFPVSPTYVCTSAATIDIGTYANDRDQPTDGLKVVFHWSLVNPRTNFGPITGHMTAKPGNGNYYQGTTSSFDGKTFYSGRITAWAVTTDKYGGTTESPHVTSGILACQ